MAIVDWYHEKLKTQKHATGDTFESTKLVKKSPKQDAKLSKIKHSIADEESNENFLDAKKQ